MTGKDLGFDPYTVGELNIDHIKEIIPHREPFIWIDRVIELESDKAVAVKDVRAEEEHFKGHFPGNPVMPGVLMLEALAQTMGIMVCSRPEHRGKNGFFASINNVRFREIVRPGDELILTVTAIREKKRFFTAKGIASVKDKDVAEAELMLVVMDKEND